jgi:hypothetical protein
VIMHYDGNRWETLEPPPGFSNVGISIGFETGELIVSNGRDVWLYDDRSWSELPRAPYGVVAIEGTEPDDLYGLTYSGIVHYDGVGWTESPIGEPFMLNDIDVSETGVTVVGSLGRIDRLIDGEWSSVNIDSTVRYNSVAVTPGGRTFVSDYYRIWEIVGSGAVMLLDDEIQDPILCADDEALYVAGRGRSTFDGHIISRYSNGAWQQIDEGAGRVYDFWVGRGEIAAAGEVAFLWHGSDEGGAPVSPAPNRDQFRDAVAIGDAVYTIGRSSYRYQHGTWTNLDKEYITSQPAERIDGRHEDNIYAVADRMILRFDGHAWTWVNAGLGLWVHSVCVLPNGNVVAAGDDNSSPHIIEFDGATWTKRTLPMNFHTFWDITSVGDLVVAVGDRGYIGMRKGTDWTFVRPTSADLVSVWAFDERHIYAASTARNEICVFNGRAWDATYIEGPTLPRMRSIWGTSPSNLFALDDSGVLARFDGSHWVEEPRVFTGGMRSVSGTGREVLTVGDVGAAVYRR